VEGPIIAVIAGFLCAGGILNPWIVFPIVVAGDITGDTIVYMLGRWGKPAFLNRVGKWIGLSPGKIERVREIFTVNPVRTISLSKIVLGIGVAGIFLAGNARVGYQKFISICLVTSAAQYIIYLGIGLLFGDAYKQISHYLDLFAAVSVTAGAAIILFFIIRSIRKKI
jgi:membrane protein DedA with SNARE-associated domain